MSDFKVDVVLVLSIIAGGILLAIIALVVRIITRKISRAVSEVYQQKRYDVYSRLIDDVIAESPEEEVTHVKKQPGDTDVLQRLLEQKLVYIKGDDRTRVAGEIKELSFVSDYIGELGADESSQRATALQVLGDLRIVDTAGYFLEALEDPDPDVRLTAARGLAKMAEEAKLAGSDGNRARFFIESIVSLLEKPEKLPWRRLAEIVVSLGADAVEPLITAVYSSKPQIRSLAADMLGEIHDWRAVDPLIELLEDESTDVRARAAGGLGEIGNHRAVVPLTRSLQDGAWPVRARAAKALAKIGDPATVWPMARLLGDPEWWVRYNTGFALAEFGEPGFEALEKNLANPDRYARERALEVIEETGRVQRYFIDLGNPDPIVKNRAIMVLVAAGRGGGMAPLIDAAREVTEPRSITSIIEIWREVTEHLLYCLSAEEKSGKLQAIESINKIVFSYVMEKIDLFANLDIEGVPTSVAEVQRNMDKIQKGLVLLKQDFDQEVRAEAASTLSYMERA